MQLQGGIISCSFWWLAFSGRTAHQEIAGRAVDEKVQATKACSCLLHPSLAVCSLPHITLRSIATASQNVVHTRPLSCKMHAHSCVAFNRIKEQLWHPIVGSMPHKNVCQCVKIHADHTCSPRAMMPSPSSAVTASSNTCCRLPLMATAAP